MSFAKEQEELCNLSAVQMRYLYKIYQISLSKPEVLSADIARKLKVSKPSVAKMLSVLSEKKLILKKRYGKISITDSGKLIADEYEQRIKMLASLIPKMGLVLTD
ncbi:MAG: hypothetical protein IJ858_09235 [Acidaminococcaceae bacterium]|nr:hypothetical protein [Acidaminococcaceae bacterium]MBR1662446.1 hypothetical protein [Acidaminococcaceae bacterium]MBR2183593.1 hypothetical protein [Acidaminococcaceae bacterium]